MTPEGRVQNFRWARTSDGDEKREIPRRREGRGGGLSYWKQCPHTHLVKGFTLGQWQSICWKVCRTWTTTVSPQWLHCGSVTQNGDAFIGKLLHRQNLSDQNWTSRTWNNSLMLQKYTLMIAACRLSSYLLLPGLIVYPVIHFLIIVILGSCMRKCRSTA